MSNDDDNIKKDAEAEQQVNNQGPLDENQSPVEENPEKELDLILELQEEKGKRLQLMADFQNYQKRIQDEKGNWGAIANLSLIQELLEVHDDIELALNDEDLDLNRSKEALRSAQDKLTNASLRAGVEKVMVKPGDDFDKEKMEAVSTIQVQDEAQRNKVIAVISSAYKYTNRDGILKPAKVIVGK